MTHEKARWARCPPGLFCLYQCTLAVFEQHIGGHNLAKGTFACAASLIRRGGSSLRTSLALWCVIYQGLTTVISLPS